MSEETNWFSTGFSGIDEEEERRASAVKPRRYWMKVGGKQEIIFVDDEPCNLVEHQYQSNGNWNNFLTCAQGIHDDVVCCDRLGRNKRTWVGYLTIINCAEWTDGSNNKRKYELELFRANKDVLKILRTRKEDEGSLVGAMFSVGRIGQKSMGCGNDFQFKKFIEFPKLLEVVAFKGKKLSELIQAANSDEKEMRLFKSKFQVQSNSDGKIEPDVYSFNYHELLRPKSPKEMKMLLNGVKHQESNGASKDPSGTEDQVPF